MSDRTELVLPSEHGGALDWTALLQKSVPALEPEDVLLALSLVDVVRKALVIREAELKTAAVALVGERGEPKSDKTKRLEMEGAVVEVTQKAPQLKVDEKKLRKVLRDAAIPEEDIFDRLPVLNKKKLEVAIVQGRLTEAHVAEFTISKPSSPAVAVKKVPYGITKEVLLGRDG